MIPLKNRKTEKGREPSQARRDERKAPRQTTRSNQVEERRDTREAATAAVTMRAQDFVFKEREAEGGEEWKREGWPDAQIGGRTWEWEVRKEQQGDQRAGS